MEITQDRANAAGAELTARAIRAYRAERSDHTSGRYEGYLQALSLLTGNSVADIRTAVVALADNAAVQA